MPENQNDDSTIPSKPGENEIADYYDGLKELEMQGLEAGVRKARNALFVTAGLMLVGELISVALAGLALTPVLIGIALTEAAIFAGLAIWTNKKPYTAIIVGLVVFIGLWIVAIIGAGFKGAIGGIIVRIIILNYLVRALKPAKAWEEAKRNR